MNWSRASNKLSDLELSFEFESHKLEILWYRIMEMNGDWCIDRHTHSTYEIHIIAKGACKVKLDNDVFIAKEGSFYMTPPGVYHEQLAYNQDCFIEYSMNIDIIKKQRDVDYGLLHKRTEMDNIIFVFEQAICKIYMLNNTNILELFHKALIEADDEDLGYYTIIKSITQELIIEMARIMKEDVVVDYIDVPKKLKANTERLRLINQYIDDNLCNKIKVINIAQHMHLSEKQINRIVELHTGSSIKALIKGKKLEEAKKILRSTQLTQKEIAVKLGFTSEYYFNQFFKREEGDTPGNFRENSGNVRKH